MLPGLNHPAHRCRQIITYSFYLSSIVLAQYSPPPRWAQAVALLDNTLYVHGGLSDPFNSYSYSSAPEISDLLVLDLSTSFDSSSPPWKLFPADSSLALAWHTLSAFNPTELLLFGGQPSPNSLTVLTDLSDSSGLLSTFNESGPAFTMEPRNWANEPMRRIRHSSSYTSGKVWLIGGEKADGSGSAFGDHYYFDPSGPEFVQLPSPSSGPPDIYGHASLVLPDGRLLVFGGYCASCSDLIPMNTAWSLNTTQNSLVWERLFISNVSLPSPRRDFAAVVLSSGQILIHGGGDAHLQTTYGDGWVLDTSQNPMVWKNVPALSQLGQRKDHFAVQAGGYVLFCFGYGPSSPASASLFIYDPTTSSMVTSYSAPSLGLTPAITSLPPPTQTGAPGATPVDGSGTPLHTPSSTFESGDHTTAIALGTTLGVLGLMAGGLMTLYYVKRMRSRDRRTARTFFPLADDPEFSPEGSVAGAIPVAAHIEDEGVGGVVMTGILAHLGLSKYRSMTHQPRKDMFADEDIGLFGKTGHSDSLQREDTEETGAWSLRSVGVLVRDMIGGGPGESRADRGDHAWEKVDHLRQADEEDFIRQESTHSDFSSRPIHRKDGSFWSYTDPFEDPIRDDNYDLKLSLNSPEKDADYNRSDSRSDETDDFEWTALATQDPIRFFSVRSHILAPLREVSQTSFLERSNSPPSLQEPSYGQITHSCADNPALSPPVSMPPTPQSPTDSRSCDSYAASSARRHSVVSGSILSRSHSASRPDSWWSRLTKPPLLDRRTSITAHKPLDFRDPTPAPSLIPSEETKKCSPSPEHLNDSGADIAAGHGRSLSSAHSGRTANTNSAERLGGSYDVVQRLASDGSSSRRAPSLGSAEITEQGMLATDSPAPSEIAMSSGLPHVDPPRSAPLSTEPAMSSEVRAPSGPPVRSTSNLTSPKRGPIVGSRIRAYELWLSQELESQQIPGLRNTRRCEQVPARTRPTIQYGVAPRAPLFIANPDLGYIS